MWYELTTGGERECGILIGQMLWDTMYQLDEDNVLSLCTDTDHQDSVYRHVSEALDAVLRQLGVTNLDLAYMLLLDSNDFKKSLTSTLEGQEAGRCAGSSD